MHEWRKGQGLCEHAGMCCEKATHAGWPNGNQRTLRLCESHAREFADNAPLYPGDVSIPMFQYDEYGNLR